MLSLTAPTLQDQGENNVGEDDFYACAFSSLITSWRKAMQREDAPFIFVQLPEYMNSCCLMPTCSPACPDDPVRARQLASFRDTQLAALALPHTAAINTVDNGDPLGHDTSIHTLDKTTVARRMSLALRALAFNDSEVIYRAPSYKHASASTRGSLLLVTITFNDVPASTGLRWVKPTVVGPHANSSGCPHQWGVPIEACAWFEIQDSAGEWHNATATIVGTDTLQLTAQAPIGRAAVATSNGYADWPVVNVYAGELPLLPWGPRNISQHLESR